MHSHTFPCIFMHLSHWHTSCFWLKKRHPHTFSYILMHSHASHTYILLRKQEDCVCVCRAKNDRQDGWGHVSPEATRLVEVSLQWPTHPWIWIWFIHSHTFSYILMQCTEAQNKFVFVPRRSIARAPKSLWNIPPSPIDSELMRSLTCNEPDIPR